MRGAWSGLFFGPLGQKGGETELSGVDATELAWAVVRDLDRDAQEVLLTICYGGGLLDEDGLSGLLEELGVDRVRVPAVMTSLHAAGLVTAAPRTLTKLELQAGATVTLAIVHAGPGQVILHVQVFQQVIQLVVIGLHFGTHRMIGVSRSGLLVAFLIAVIATSQAASELNS